MLDTPTPRWPSETMSEISPLTRNSNAVPIGHEQYVLASWFEIVDPNSTSYELLRNRY
jgi:hypothetical protein